MDNCVCQEYGLIWGSSTIWGPAKFGSLSTIWGVGGCAPRRPSVEPLLDGSGMVFVPRPTGILSSSFHHMPAAATQFAVGQCPLPVLFLLYAVVKLLSKRWWIPIGARPEGQKLEPKGP